MVADEQMDTPYENRYILCPDSRTITKGGYLMANELQLIIEKAGLESTKAQYILENFQDYFKIAAEWEEKAKAIIVTDAEQKVDMKMARTGRLFLREKRITIEKARKRLKEQSLREGKAIDGIANVLKALIVPIEQHLEKQEKFVEIRAAEKAEAERIEQERKAEEERIAKEKAEAEERERIRVENERLKREAEERERKMAEEREKARKEKEKAEAERRALEKEAHRKQEEARRREREFEEKRIEKERELEESRKKEEKARQAKKKAEEELKSMIKCPFCKKMFKREIKS